MATTTKQEKEETPKPNPFFQKKKVLYKQDNDHVSLRLFVDISCIEGAPIIIGFPNIGITPVLTCNYLVEDLNLPLIGTVAPEDMASTSVVSRIGQPCHAIRIFGDKRLVVLCSELKIPDKLLNGLSTSIVSFTQNMKSEMVWCIEGVPVEKVDKIEREEMQYLTTCTSIGEKLKSLGHKILHDAVVAGVTGGILSEFVDCGSEGDITVILAPTSSFYPDAWASVMVIRLLDSLYDEWTSNTEKLEKSATSLEKTVKKLMSESLQRSSKDTYSSMYN